MVSSRYLIEVNLYSFLRRLRREAIPPVLVCEQEAVWPDGPAAAAADAIAPPSVPWRLTYQDADFLKRRLRIDPE